MEGRWVSSGKLIPMEQLTFYLVFICTTADMHEYSMARGGQMLPRKSEAEFPRGAGVQETEGAPHKGWSTVNQW